ncbi:MAG TPA: M6 family metalloprotease domain-containing protein [Longimicrobium sp.]|jgi:M6 family metalloprotease-like protein|uniref:M6 family metalloprotease domain-containing protein n=1 Tax=Longimicrobium sp. TaxID=2029185 RepID=UPI002EDAF461
MTRPILRCSLACAALLLAAGAPALAAQDVVEAGRAHGIAPTPELLRLLREDSTAFEFQRAWRQKTQRVRLRRAALERRSGLRLSVQELSAAEAAVTGTLRVPVLMGLYADAAAPHPQSDYQTRLFGPQQYSARTFYQEMSRGVFTLDGTVTPWITLPQNAAYYQPSSATDARYGRAGEYLQHTLQGADAQVDFGQFDNDGPDGVPNSGDDDGYVDAAAFVYPAAGMSCGGPGIWPHRWVYRAWFGAPFTTGDARAGGGFILVDDYLIQGGLECDGAGLMQIGTFSHEMGHALGLPDLYDTYAADGTSSGLGEWDLMSSGNWRLQDAPAHMGAWSKDYLGWVNVETVTASRAVTLPQVYAGGTVLRYDLPGTPEYFLMENRGMVGSDRNLRRAGLLVYHVDPAVIDSTRGWNRVNGHPRMGVALEQADGADHLGAGSNRGDAGDPFPGSTGRTAFGDTGTPNTRSNSATASDLELRNLALNGATNAVTFDIVVGTMLTAPATARLRSRADTAATLQIAVATTSGSPVGVRARKALGSAWLTVSPDTASAPAVLVLTARGQGLAPGVYRDTVLITSSSAVNSPLRTVVEYTVQPGLLVPGDSAAGRIGGAGQRDTLLVQAAAGDVLDFAVFDAGAGTFSPTMTLVSPAGAAQALPVVTTGARAGVRRGRVSAGRALPTAGVWRVVISSSQGAGDYVFKVRPAGPVPAAEPGTRMYLPVPVDGATGRDTMWVGNAGTGVLAPVITPMDAPWLAVGSASAAAGAPRAPAPSGPALAAPGGPAPAAASSAAAEEGGAPSASHPGSTPVLLTATRGARTQGDYTGYVAVQAADGWAGPAVVEVRMRVHEREVVFLTPARMASRPVALAVAPEGDLGVVLVDGQVLRMDPVTGATRPWATTTTSAWWGMSFGPDSAAYIAEHQRVTRVAKDGTTSIALSALGTVYDVVVTPAGDLYAAADEGLWRVPRGGAASRVFTESTYGVAYNAGDGMVYASMVSTQAVRRVNPATGTVTATVMASDNSIQQQVEIGEGGAFYGRSYYLDYPDLRRFTAQGQLDRSWWTPQPFPQAMALAPDGTLYGTAGDRVFRLRVEGTPPVTHVAGDATGDGRITAQDALAVLSSAVGKTLPDGWTAAYGDANCDRQVTAQDALIILSHAVGKDVAQFCVGQPQP